MWCFVWAHKIFTPLKQNDNTRRSNAMAPGSVSCCPLFLFQTLKLDQVALTRIFSLIDLYCLVWNIANQCNCFDFLNRFLPQFEIIKLNVACCIKWNEKNKQKRKANSRKQLMALHYLWARQISFQVSHRFLITREQCSLSNIVSLFQFLVHIYKKL